MWGRKPKGRDIPDKRKPAPTASPSPAAATNVFKVPLDFIMQKQALQHPNLKVPLILQTLIKAIWDMKGK